MKNLGKGLFLAFVLYHSIVICFTPNASSVLGRQYQSLYLPYANTVGANLTWQFFAPNPWQPTYIRYTVDFLDDYGDELKESISGIYPETGLGLPRAGVERRFYVSMRFFTMDPNRFKALFGSWFCRRFPEATQITGRQILLQTMEFDRAAKVSLGATQDSFFTERIGEPIRINCQEPEEVAL